MSELSELTLFDKFAIRTIAVGDPGKVKADITAGCDEFTSTAGVYKTGSLAAHIRKGVIQLQAVITGKWLQASTTANVSAVKTTYLPLTVLRHFF